MAKKIKRLIIYLIVKKQLTYLAKFDSLTIKNLTHEERLKLKVVCEGIESEISRASLQGFNNLYTKAAWNKMIISRTIALKSEAEGIEYGGFLHEDPEDEARRFAKELKNNNINWTTATDPYYKTLPSSLIHLADTCDMENHRFMKGTVSTYDGYTFHLFCADDAMFGDLVGGLCKTGQFDIDNVANEFIEAVYNSA